MSAPARSPQDLDDTISGGIGDSPLRPDGTLKVRGEFAFASDLWHEDMLWGATLRSPHPHARITRLDTAPALAVPGVHAVLTHEDVPGENVYGLKHQDTPVLAEDLVRYQGEPVALVAADHPEIARRALKAIVVEYEVLDPITDPERAAHDDTLPALHPGGNLVRHQRIVKGDPDARPRPSWCPGCTRSACRTRRSSARRPASRCRPRTAASTSTSPPSGCTSTRSRPRTHSGCRWRRCG